MKKQHVVWVAVCFLAAAVCSVAEEAGTLTVGVKAWNSDPEYNADAVLVWGPLVSINLGGNFWLSGLYLQGERDYDLGFSSKEHDAEAIFGMSFDMFDIGVGGRYSKYSETEAFGPMAFAGLGSLFGDMPLGWYATAGWMFYDFGDAEDAENTLVHYNAEAGLSYIYKMLVATVGFRYRDYYELDQVTEQGFTGSVSVRF